MGPQKDLGAMFFHGLDEALLLQQEIHRVVNLFSSVDAGITGTHQIQRFVLDEAPTASSSDQLQKSDRANQKLWAMQNYRLALEDLVRGGFSLKDDQKFLSYFLERLGWKVPNDFSDLIRDEILVEIYSLDGMQLFRNFKFFEISSYSLEQLLTEEWFTLYERPQKSMHEMQKGVEIVLVKNTTMPLRVQPHLLREIRSPLMQCSWVEFGYLAPVWNLHGDICGLAVTSTAEVVEQHVKSADLNFI